MGWRATAEAVVAVFSRPIAVAIVPSEVPKGGYLLKQRIARLWDL
jgi:hypothetical protein